MSKATHTTKYLQGKGGNKMYQARRELNRRAKLPAFSLAFPEDRIKVLVVPPNGKGELVTKGSQLLTALQKDGEGNYVIREGWSVFPVIEGCTDIRMREVNEHTLVQRNTESGAVRAAVNVQDLEVLYKDPANLQNIESKVVKGFDNTDMSVMSVEAFHEMLGQFIAQALLSIGEKKAAKALQMSGYAQMRAVTTEASRTALVAKTDGFEIFGAYFANPAQVRKGETSYFRFAETSDFKEAFPIMKDLAARIAPFYERFLSEYNLADFGKVKDGIRTMNADKDAKRVPLNQGGSRKSILMDAIGPMTLDGEVPFINGDGVQGTAKVYRSLKKVPELGNQIIKFAVGPDMVNMVSPEDALITSVVDGVKSVVSALSIFGADFMMPKNTMDGSGVIDTSMSAFMKKEGVILHEGQGVQGRAPGMKGLFIPVPELLERLGVHAYFGDGAVKLDPVQHLVEGTFQLSILQATRLEIEKESSVISTQALVAMQTPAEILQELHAQAEHKLHASLEDGKLALQVLDAQLVDDGEEVSVNPVVSRLQQNPDSLKDGAFRRRYAKLLSKTMEKLAYGAVLAEDVRMRHMITDPYALLVALEGAFKNGKVVFPRSIPAGCVLAPNHEGGARTGEAVAARFPMVSYFEPRKVTAIGFEALDADARAYYEKYMAQGFFQGLVMFSAHDMITEAMSGADFDGDTCLLIFNDLLVAHMGDYPMFLDYTSKDGGLPEGGCPFSDPVPALSLEQVMGRHMPACLEGRVEQVKDAGGYLTWNMRFQEEDVQAHPEAVFFVWQQMAAAKTLKEAKRAEIGEWSNHTALAQDILSEVKREARRLYALAHNGSAEAAAELNNIELEIVELENLIIWLTNAVRWAIDEAKHGGAFKRELERELEIFLKPMNVKEFSSFDEFAKRYGRSAIRFFIGR